MRSDYLVFGSPLIGEEEIAEVVDTLRSGWLGTGPKTKRFEREFADYTRARHAIALNSCTAALHLALDILGIGPGDEVITSPLTFAATANVILHRGATPVFVDVERNTMNMDPAALDAAVTDRTKCIIPVHLAGRPCDLTRIGEIAARRRIPVLEDAAHATEAFQHGRKIGSISAFTAFSFYATKNLVTGEGGMLTTNDSGLAEAARVRSLHGLSKDAWKRYSSGGYQPYETVYPGYKYNMTDMQSALGIHQLARIDENLKIRERHSQRYDAAFSEFDELITPSEPLTYADDVHGRHLYPLLIRTEKLMPRNDFIQELHRRNIGSGVHFVAIHLHQYYREALGFQRGRFPNAEWVSDRTVSLPLSAKLTNADVEDVIAAVGDIVSASRRA